MVNDGVACARFDSDLSADLSCAWDEDADTLTVSGAFSSALSAGTATGFYVKSITNPITQSDVTFTLRTLDSDSNAIDESTLTYAATSSAELDADEVSITASDSSVQSTTAFTLKFDISVPLNSGCQISVTFPSEITFTTDSLTTVTGSGAIVGAS
jgi:hypothetical protein